MSQVITGIGTKYADDLTEWIFYTEEDEEIGTLQPTFINDLSHWNWNIGDLSGSIALDKNASLREWEIFCENRHYYIRQTWRNDLSIWSITNDRITLNVEAEYKNTLETWNASFDRSHKMEITTYREFDPREWYVQDTLENTTPLPMKVGAIFIAVLSRISREF